MAPRRFRLSRISLILSDPTRTVEVIVAICNFIIPGIALMSGTSQIPLATELLLAQLLVNEHVIGVAAICIGASQVYAAGTDWHDLRGAIATGAACLIIALAVGYWFTGYGNRQVVSLMVGTVFAELFIAWRCYHEKPDPLPSNRDGPGR